MRKLLLIALTFFFASSSFAQCPIPAACTPGGPDSSDAFLFSMGIRNVSIGSINKSTGFINTALAVSYHDYSCIDSTDIQIGINQAVSVTTNGSTGGLNNENLRIWIDLNNDGVFDPISELVFESLDARVHTGTIQLPGSTIADTPLRMRVAAEWVNIPSSGLDPCSNRVYSEVEDYMIVARVNSSPPSPAFTGDPQESCDGIVQFIDQSVNGPTSWLWKFGDGFTDTVQNPLHTYLVNDTFDVTLIVGNANGLDSITVTDYIIKNGIKPVNAVCSPFTNAYCCGYGITRFVLGDIDNSSADASVGYEDFSCLEFTNLTEGFQESITINTNSSQAEDIRVYLDLNSDGDFNDPGELLLEVLNSTSPYTGNLIIPGSKSPYSQPLRLRVKSDAVGNFFDGCSNLNRGQAEDYTVLMNPNPFPPLALFSEDQINSCQDSVNFQDLSLNVPNTWFWNFGDGNTDTVRNPNHVYAANGTYVVSLVVCNLNGCDSTTRTISYREGATLPNCITTTQFGFFANRITNFKLGTIDYSSPGGSNAPEYEDFACETSTDLVQGNATVVEIQSSQSFGTYNFTVWIDFNDDHDFTTNEIVFSSTGVGLQSGFITVPLTGNIVLNQALRLRVNNDFSSQPVKACGQLQRGQTEDYTVVIRAPQAPPIASFVMQDSVTCSGFIQFQDQSGFNPTSWTWKFGDGQTSNLQNPDHEYQGLGTFNVELVACNAFGCDSTTQTANVTGLFGAKLANCIPSSSSISQNGIFNVTLSNINQSTLANTDYTDYSCDKISNLTSGVASVLEINTGVTISTKVGVWIDYNNSGTFTSSEKVMTSSGFGVHQAAIIIPGNAVKYKVLRMRVMAEVDFGNPPDPLPCNNLINGETEDYGIYIADNNAGAIAFFETNQQVSCNGQVAFRNNSFPNATGFEWFFGDGGTSTSEHPVHQYSTIGSFDVTLIAKNGFGSDTLTKPAYVQVTGTSGLPMANCYPITQFINEEFGVFRFSFESINKNNNIGQGFEDYSCNDTTTLHEGSSYGFLVNTGPDYFGRVGIWIDYNNDGDFDDTDEQAFLGSNQRGNHLGTITVPASVAAESQFLRLRIVCDQLGSPAPNPCVDPEYGQVEDYSVFISPSGLSDLIKSNVSLYPNPVEDYLSLDYPKDWELGINLYDLNGIKLLSIDNLNENRINLSEFNQGLYLLEVKAKGQFGHFKLIKK